MRKLMNAPDAHPGSAAIVQPEIGVEKEPKNADCLNLERSL